ncbi:EAL domain-containing protein [Picosynechococcus sp. NKBG15041c]|uniref:sensor domain-containing phosphodiesterase n=1 Tax=Picosynechococcus sp. NKBG15041c TaxID=1407650 RepID=UPI0004069FC0|nr:EAL domain-containing protein [Picosynechococcus sp. NKBG15041c]
MDKAPILDFIRDHINAADKSSHEQIQKTLQTIRAHLGLEVAFLAEFTEGQRVFRYVDSSHPQSPIRVGGADPLEESYCQRIIDGRLPELILDATQLPAAQELAVTTALPVGAHLSVPVRLKDGTLYGTFCCFSFTPNQSLNERDLAIMRVAAEFAAAQIEHYLEAERLKSEIRERIHAVLSGDALSMVYQPIYHLAENRVVGLESLARFFTTPMRSPDIWFNEAAYVDLSIPLELMAIQLALDGIKHFPADTYVAVNISPKTILDGKLGDALAGWPLGQIVLEVTEHAVIDHYDDITRVVNPLRQRGLRIAVDDAGAGYASFRHILNLAPDVIKLDISITRNIDTDRSRRALAAALISFAQETGSKIVAEGVETASELAVLQELGINKAQGYFLGKPMSLKDASQLVQSGCSSLV